MSVLINAVLLVINVRSRILDFSNVLIRRDGVLIFINSFIMMVMSLRKKSVAFCNVINFVFIFYFFCIYRCGYS